MVSELLAAAEVMGLARILSKRREAPYVSSDWCGWCKSIRPPWIEANRACGERFERAR